MVFRTIFSRYHIFSSSYSSFTSSSSWTTVSLRSSSIAGATVIAMTTAGIALLDQNNASDDNKTTTPSTTKTILERLSWQSKVGGNGTTMSTTSAERASHFASSSNHNNKTLSETKTKEIASDDNELFEGQCLKRQMYKPALPYPAWNYDWDGRMTPGTTLEAFRHGKQSIKSVDSNDGDNNDDDTPLKRRRRRKKSRHIFLVRHGQYEDKDEEKDRILTPLGRYQARATGRRLAQIAQGAKHFYPESFNGPCHFKAIYVSDLIRAKETAELIADQVKYYTPKNQLLLQPPDPLLNETLPAPMIPIRPDIPGATEEIDANQERVEEAFRKYFYRDDGIMTDLDDETSNNELDEFEVIVCHGNMIRYLLCRALQLPPEAWLRFSTFNCSITYIVIRPEGLVVARAIGDTGHLNYDQMSFSGYHGLKW